MLIASALSINDVGYNDRAITLRIHAKVATPRSIIAMFELPGKCAWFADKMAAGQSEAGRSDVFIERPRANAYAHAHTNANENVGTIVCCEFCTFVVNFKIA